MAVGRTVFDLGYKDSLQAISLAGSPQEDIWSKSHCKGH